MFKTFAFRIFIVALVLRLIPVILARGLGIGLDDMFQYDMLARSLAGGHGFRWYAEADLNQLASFVDFDLTSVKDYDPILGIPTSFRPPLYPAFLAVVYLFSGTGFSRFFVARLAQAILLGAPLAPLTYLVARRLLNLSFLDIDNDKRQKMNEMTARISAWIVTLYPMLVVFPLALATENLFVALVLASFLMLLNTWDKPTAVNFICTGILMGLSALTRSVILIFCGFVLVWFWFALKDQRQNVVLMFLTLSIVILPWMVRNSLLHHRLMGIESSLGYQLYLGYHPESTGTFQFGISLDLIPILDDGLRDKLGMEKALEFIRQDPSRFIPLMFNRLGYFFGLERRALQYFYSNGFFGFIPLPLLLIISSIFLLPFILVSILGVLGLAISRWSPQYALLALLIISYILPHLFIISEERFHVTLVPVLAILAAQFFVNGFSALSARWRESGIGKIMIIFAVCAAILLVTNWGFELVRDADKIAQLLGPTGNESYFSY